MRESSTGAEAGTFPNDGENIRSSKVSEDMEHITGKWPTEKSSGRTRTGLRPSAPVSCALSRAYDTVRGLDRVLMKLRTQGR